jgi:hypothetical protein
MELHVEMITVGNYVADRWDKYDKGIILGYVTDKNGYLNLVVLINNVRIIKCSPSDVRVLQEHKIANGVEYN